MSRSTRVRLGAVGYLNARPLVYGLEALPQFDVRYDIPSECARLLHAHDTDLGLIPSIEYLRGSSPYTLVPGPAVTSKGPVASVALAWRHLRDDQAHVREDRRARRGAQGQDQARLPGQLRSGCHARGDDGGDHHARPMIDAARAARALLCNRQRVPIVPETIPVNPADETRRRFSTIILANRIG